jgi:hypothetical protein
MEPKNGRFGAQQSESENGINASVHLPCHHRYAGPVRAEHGREKIVNEASQNPPCREP